MPVDFEESFEGSRTGTEAVCRLEQESWYYVVGCGPATKLNRIVAKKVYSSKEVSVSDGISGTRPKVRMDSMGGEETKSRKKIETKTQYTDSEKFTRLLKKRS